MKNQKLVPPFLYSTTEVGLKKWMAKLKQERLIRLIGPRLYTSLPEEGLEKAVRAHWSQIVSQLFPSALLSHRSAIEYHPTEAGEIFLTSTTNRSVQYPGLTLKFLRGPSALPDDLNFIGFKASSLPRALLENLSTAKGRDRHKILPPESIEEYLESLLLQKGESSLNEIRDQAKKITQELGWQKELEKLESLIGGLLGSRDSKKLSSRIAIARAQGNPYDPQCWARLERLFAELRHAPLAEKKETRNSHQHWTNKAFFDAYFSNYIEGTTFELREAEDIVFQKKIPPNRPKDAHDILGTYLIVSDQNEMSRTPDSEITLIELLKKRHRIMMNERPEVNPGTFKTKTNRAGSTEFTHPDYVMGTLSKGFDLYQSLPFGIKRAIFIMFLVADVHPFTDGNGRIARIMMNAELVHASSPTIIIPTVYREDYLLSLRALSRREDPTPLIRMLIQAQAFSDFDFTLYPEVHKKTEKSNWFLEPNEGKILIPQE